MKHTFKRITAFALSVITLGSLVSCGKDVEEINDSQESTSSESATDTAKTEITIGLFNELTSELPAAVKEFNRNNENYIVKIKDYSDGKSLMEMDETELNNAETQMDMDIINGNSPDIIVRNAYEITRYIQLDLFENLYSFMENSDGIKREDLIPNIVAGAEIDSELPVIMTNFYIDTSVAKTKNIPEESINWTVDDVFNTLNSLPDDMSFFFGETSKNAVASYILTIAENDFVDYGSNTCSFDSAEFIELLEKINNLDFKDYAQNDDDGSMAFMRDKYLIKQISLCGVSDAVYNIYSGNGEEMSFLGYPTADGGKNYLSAEEILGILKTSDCKEGAWEFINFLLTESNLPLDLEDRNCGIPITEAHFRSTLDAEGEGSIREPREFFWLDGQEITLTEEQITEYEQFIRSIDGSFFKNTNISNIVGQEIQSMLGGESTPEKCAEMIQDRAETYLSEQS